ncbi:MAG: hypothetical protein CNLJKLNK_00455 [Holosporales bacterium]
MLIKSTKKEFRWISLKTVNKKGLFDNKPIKIFLIYPQNMNLYQPFKCIMIDKKKQLKYSHQGSIPNVHHFTKP